MYIIFLICSRKQDHNKREGNTSSQLKPIIRNIYAPACIGYCYKSNTSSQVHVQTKHSLAHLQDLTTFADMFCIHILYQPKQELNLMDVLYNAIFVHAFGYMCLSYNSSQYTLVYVDISCDLCELATCLLTFDSSSYFLSQIKKKYINNTRLKVFSIFTNTIFFVPFTVRTEELLLVPTMFTASHV